MKEIPLTQGKYAIVDDEDYDFLNQFKWLAFKDNNTFYAARQARVNGKSRHRLCFMHRVINQTPDGLVTDHINRNGLDNRKANLRSVTHQQNLLNCKMNKTNTSGYRGVSWNKQTKKWRAEIRINNKKIHIGYFNNVLEAAAAFQVEAQKRSAIIADWAAI